jgi:hypothetical protein
MNPDDLERLVGEELARLPVPRAPRSLLPRVMAAAAQPRRQPSAVTTRTAWPRAWRLASSLAAVAAVAGLGGLAVASAWPAGWSASTVRLAHAVRSAYDGFLWLVGAARLASAFSRFVWQSLVAPVGGYLLVLSLTFSLACFGLWAALNRVAPGEVSRQ